MIQAMILAATVGSFGATDLPIHCEFPGRDAAEKTITVELDPRPSLKDQPGKFRVIMEMNERVALRAAAQPIPTTDERDILVRAITRKKNVYTIGLRDDGAAALNIRKTRIEGAEPESSTRVGQCVNYGTYFERWLSS